ncbi:MAG TPA: hypothetical protein VFS20_30695 [Longimicrobium sp.]|nr:hypothetical protein [Longimicrobium sp.]
MRVEAEARPIPPLGVREPGVVRRHVLSILDLASEEVLYLCRRALALKHAKSDPQTLKGRTVGVYFRKTPTRTGMGFIVGAGRLGATMACFGPPTSCRPIPASTPVLRSDQGRGVSGGRLVHEDLTG